ncbi:vacuolar protein sorting-associated protein 28 [Monosporozyma unispora]|nr:Vacuolar protein-sorting-associated protein 28 [Kazachstania unispora]
MSGLAPVNHYGTQGSTRTFPSELYNEVPLFDASTTSQQRETIDGLSEIYSIIIALDHVEKAYLKDSVDATQYTNSVNKLLAQYKTYLNDEKVRERFKDLTTFVKKHNIVASSAVIRIERGIPITVEHVIDDDSDAYSGNSGDKSGSRKNKNVNGKNVAEATGNFITLIDALKLNYKAKDQLHPLMAELLLSINKVSRQDFEYRQKLVDWIVKINKMKVDEQLTDTEIRELIFDLDMAYKNFYTLLE